MDSPGILDWIIDFFVKPLTEAIGKLFSPFLDAYLKEKMVAPLADLEKVKADYMTAGPVIYFKGIPKSPEEALSLVEKDADHINLDRGDVAWKMALAEAIPFIDVGLAMGWFWSTPRYRAETDVATEYFKGAYEVGIRPWLQRHWLKMYTPFVPPVDHLREMAVKEAFPIPPGLRPEEIKKHQYAEMEKWALEQGMDPYWTERYLYAGFIRMPLDQAYDNLLRGYMTLDEFKRYLSIADIHPDDWDWIVKVANRPISRYDLRWGVEHEILDRDYIIKSMRMRRISEEDAAVSADAIIAHAFDEEVKGVITQWMFDFEDGLILEDQLRANMAEVGVTGTRQDYYVSRATIRRERKRMRDLLDLYRDGYMKDLITEEELRDRAMEIIVIPEVADLFVEKAYVDKYKKPKPPTETTEDKALKELRKYQVTYGIQAYRRYAIEKPELITMLIAAGMDPDVAAARADYEELKRPIPKPSAEVIAAAKEKTRIQKLEETKAIEEFRRAVIDADQLLRRLVEIGYSEALATAIVQLEMIRKK